MPLPAAGGPAISLIPGCPSEKSMKLFHPDGQMHSQQPLFYVEQCGVRHPMSDDNVRKFLRRYGASAKKICPEVLENVHPHLWRHSRAMHLYQHGMALSLISQWLGHSNLETTLVYAYADTEQKRRAIEKSMGRLHSGSLLSAFFEKVIPTFFEQKPVVICFSGNGRDN